MFDPTIGGDPLLFQHLFWFYSHPAVYIMILPGMGVVSEIDSASRARPCSVTNSSPGASIAIAVVGFFVWGHHMFVSGQSRAARPGVLLHELHRRGALGDQGVQLDRDDAQGLDPVRRPDALRAGLHRPVHHRRPDRPVPRLPRL